MKQRCYLETSVIGYLTAWPSRDLIVAGHQQVTREWWEKRRGHFELYVSQIVLDEVSRGDAVAIRERLEAIQGIAALDTTKEAIELSVRIAKAINLPKRAEADALHIAIAAASGIDFLLTWNCSHIANAALRPLIHRICDDAGLEPPIICTPEQLLMEPPHAQ